MIRIAVVGAGLIGRKHVDVLQDLPQFELVAVVNPRSESDAFAARHGAKRFKSHKELLGACSIDCAVIASSTQTHADVALDFIAAGVPLLIEKPVTQSVAQGRAVAEAARKAGVPLLVGHHRRYNPVIAKVRDMISAQSLGPLVAFSGVWSVYKPDPYYDVAWRVGDGGGPVLINLIHEIDSLHAMLGPIQRVGVMEGARQRSHGQEETVVAIFGFADGTVGTVTLSDSAASPWSWERATGENASLFPKLAENPYRFLFERGAIEFPNLRVWQQSPADWTGPFDVSGPDADLDLGVDVFRMQLEHFAEVAASNAAPHVSIEDGVAALQVAETVRDLLAEGGGMRDVPLKG
jgi:predicted dehydrogenase